MRRRSALTGGNSIRIKPFQSVADATEAIDQTGSLKGAKIAASLRARKWKTALGPIQFDKKGDVLKSPYVFWQVKGGKFVQVD